MAVADSGKKMRRRSRSSVRTQRIRRLARKRELVQSKGGRCQDCGYRSTPSALEFHHRVADDKSFVIGNFTGSLARLLVEAEKCDLLCANCHRLRHAGDRQLGASRTVAIRRRTKARAVVFMGNRCETCGLASDPTVFEFHHLDATTKEFEITSSGIHRPWARVKAELAKCVMLCANCHREVHAGVRELDEGLLGLADPPALYAA